VAGSMGSLHRSEADARACSREFEPLGCVSTGFATSKEAQKWIAANLADPHSSATDNDTTDAASTDDEPSPPPHRARAMSNVVPPPSLAPTGDAATPFRFITRDTSVGTKDEIFGIGMKKERALIKALTPRGSSLATMTALVGCVNDSTALPGTYSGTDDAVMEQDVAESGRLEMAETLSAALDFTRGRQGILGHTGQIDTTWRTRRISLRSVRKADDLHILERNLGRAVTDATENMELAFGSVLDSFQWTDLQLDTYFTGGLLPFLGVRSMTLYADLVRELASRVTQGWEQTKLDVKYFYDKLARIRTTAPSRLMFLCRTYVCLRDQKAAHYHTMDRYAAHFEQLYNHLGEPRGEPGAVPCAKCKQSHLHLGGRGGCPFRSLTDAKARVAGTFAAEQVASGMSKTRAYEAALAEG
jgi:hypothetical protein